MRPGAPAKLRPPEPALAPRAVALALLFASAGCGEPRAYTVTPPPSSMLMIAGAAREERSGTSSISDLTPALLGKPYRDLRRHTSYQVGEVSGIDVSPDGANILYASTQDGPTPNLYVKDLNGAAVGRKSSGRWWDIQPRFSPDGRWIAFASNREGNFDIWAIPATGAGGAEQVTSSKDDEVHPSWSPDGRKIAFSRLSPTHGWNLWTIDQRDQTAVELGPGLYPDWSPTGEWIVFQKPSEREPHWFGLWIIRPDGSEVRQVVAPEGFGAMEPVWAPAGDLLAFVTVKKAGEPGRGSGSDIRVVELAHGKMYQITEGPGTESAPAWGLNGRIYFVSDRLGQRGIWSLVPPEVKE